MIMPRPENWGRAFYMFFLVKTGIRTQLEFRLSYSITETNPDLNEYGGSNTFDNALFNNWFKYNLLYGGSGMKHGFNGLASALYAVMVLQIVGVTDLLQLIGGFMFTFLGFLNLWYVEYTYGNRIKTAYSKERRKGRSASGLDTFTDERDTRDTDLSLGEYDDNETQVGKDRYNKDPDIFGKALEKAEVEWAAYFISVFSIMYVFVLVISYFAFVVSKGGARWYVWVAVIYYMIYNMISFFLLGAHHSNSAGPGGIFTQYWHVEGITLCIHAFAFAFVPLCVIFGSMDTGYLYAIAIV